MDKMPLSDPLTIRLPVDVLADIETIAATAERSRSWVIVRALRAYLLAEGADVLDIAEGLKDADAGRIRDAEIVLGELESLSKPDAA